MLKVNEIFYSVQGEGTSAGLPCVFVRLTFCNLRCTYCDTEYAFYEGKDLSISEIIDEIKKYDCKLVEVTGGEPLVQMDKEGVPLDIQIGKGAYIGNGVKLNYNVEIGRAAYINGNVVFGKNIKYGV